MKKKSSNWFEGKYVAMKDGGYLDITEAMHDSCDGKFCFQVTAEIFRNCSRNEDGTIYLIDDADDKTVKKIASARSSLNPKKVRAELHRLKSEGIFMFEPYSPKSYWKHGVYRLVKSFPWRETLSFEEQIQEGMIFDSVAIQYIFFVNVQLTNGELIPFPISKLGKYTDTLSRKEEAEKLAREAVQEVKNVLLPEAGKRHRNSINLFGKEVWSMIDMVWLMKAIEAVKAGEAECLEKDGVIVYKPKADVNIRIDIKNKQ